ncbi:MAG: JDVT-CTERM system glutamic-type intramembrane protease [Pseudomonadota bacterium]
MWTLCDYILALTVYPLLEEWVFRGGMQSYLTQRNKASTLTTRYGFTIANIATSFSFSIAHCMTRGISTACFVFFPSLVLGWCRDRGLSMRGCVIVHILANMIYFLGDYYMRTHTLFF